MTYTHNGSTQISDWGVKITLRQTRQTLHSVARCENAALSRAVKSALVKAGYTVITEKRAINKSSSANRVWFPYEVYSDAPLDEVEKLLA